MVCVDVPMLWALEQAAKENSANLMVRLPPGTYNAETRHVVMGVCVCVGSLRVGVVSGTSVRSQLLC